MAINKTWSGQGPCTPRPPPVALQHHEILFDVVCSRLQRAEASSIRPAAGGRRARARAEVLNFGAVPSGGSRAGHALVIARQIAREKTDIVSYGSNFSLRSGDGGKARSAVRQRGRQLVITRVGYLLTNKKNRLFGSGEDSHSGADGAAAVVWPRAARTHSRESGWESERRRLSVTAPAHSRPSDSSRLNSRRSERDATPESPGYHL
ncbi:hypothetical protein EVAR_14655_1 [Eumeta japonica]|uniref:Uncharacterized protein n=1 Tax=Eumeta variegata TaxID=151549 RepID=A0A4C1U3K6_EUMVA|nr:hypothetical protein EVAR_14655_1 [Eumeta japonica]